MCGVMTRVQGGGRVLMMVRLALSRWSSLPLRMFRPVAGNVKAPGGIETYQSCMWGLESFELQYSRWPEDGDGML